MTRLILILCVLPVAAFAHGGIVVDGDFSDWAALGNGDCADAPPSNSGAYLDVSHAHCLLGVPDEGREWVWTDAGGDERTDFATPDAALDLVELRLTADANALYFLARFSDLTTTVGDGATQIQIAIRSNQSAEIDQALFGEYSETNVDPQAAWQRLLITLFGSGSSSLLVLHGDNTTLFGGSAAIDINQDAIEGSIPWWDLGFADAPEQLRFTIAVFRANSKDTTYDTFELALSDAMDVVTAVGPNTWDEVNDGTVNAFHDVPFGSAATGAQGEPYPTTWGRAKSKYR